MCAGLQDTLRTYLPYEQSGPRHHVHVIGLSGAGVTYIHAGLLPYVYHTHVYHTYVYHTSEIINERTKEEEGRPLEVEVEALDLWV